MHTPCLAWVTPGVRQQLLEYASLQNETVERLAGDLLLEALRARNAPPALWQLPSTEPEITRSTFVEAEALLREMLGSGRCTGEAVINEAIARRIPREVLLDAADFLHVKKSCSMVRTTVSWWWSLPTP